MLDSKRKIIVFDGDSVLLDWFDGFLTFLKSKGFSVDHVEHFTGTTRFVPTEEITRIDCKEENKKLMKEFADSGYLSRLRPFVENAVEIMADLNKDYDFAVITCIGKTEDIVSQRTKNLQDLHGDNFIKIYCLDYGESKEEPLREIAKLGEVVAFIDDRKKHLEESLAAGIKPILMCRGEDVSDEDAENYAVISCLSQIRSHIENN